MSNTQQNAQTIKKWTLYVHREFIESLRPHPKVQGLFKYQPQAWYTHGVPFYTREEQIYPQLVYNLLLREKNGIKYFLITKTEKEVQSSDFVLLRFDSGDLWRSSYSVDLLDGWCEEVAVVYGGSRGGAHSRQIHILVAKIGSVFKVFDAGFKSRHPSTKVYRVQMVDRYLILKDGKPNDYLETGFSIDLRDYLPDWADKEPYSYEKVTIPDLVEVGTEEDYIVSQDL